MVTVRERDTCLEYKAEHHPTNSACVCVLKQVNELCNELHSETHDYGT